MRTAVLSLALLVPVLVFPIVWVCQRSNPAAQVPPVEELLRGAHELPDGSAPLQGIALLAIWSIDPESAQGSVMAPALASVARSGIGPAGAQWARRALANPARAVRREAVIWYPKIHPTYRDDPAAAALFEAARSSLAGQ